MARIARVPAHDAGQDVDLTYRYTRQGLAALTGFSEGMVCAVAAVIESGEQRT
jgi:hypothetical protein